MELVTRIADVPLRGTGNIVAIGKWDGIHLAHQAILRALVNEARRVGGQSVAIGFHPLPMAVLRPELAPPMLQTLEERAEVMAALGVDVHLALPFDRAFADLTPEAFVHDVLVGQLGARQVMVGFNNTFGRGGKGTAETMRQLCAPLGIPVHVFQPVRVDGENVSSTEVRFAVAKGRMESAARLLGRPFAIRGTVVSGDQRGRQLGYPTANIRIEPGRLLPAPGVYVARVTLLGEPRPLLPPATVAPRSGPVYGAMLNLGTRPTVGGSELRCEAHLFDFGGDLYGSEVQVDFLQYLRPERAFPGVEALVAQLRADEQAARAWLERNA
ncbi:riboflavin kinase/FMN adenylyltransferase [Symbiobacterium terraclitae]|uniref:Riboflavin biosynthesis protein n=1 Tax=Symbiobacterium terraclitae TaxID=557451 RepID=A0ABS4JQ37_9FIRM|nr:bifunctional riboflavin kinase/FAD synthetase [Symbiobacterium terraclitae]MBP2017658.1 riboflavin kinase/FMN adenylyltransferase [Symbiobacterium terraclitae]